MTQIVSVNLCGVEDLCCQFSSMSKTCNAFVNAKTLNICVGQVCILTHTVLCRNAICKWKQIGNTNRRVLTTTLYIRVMICSVMISVNNQMLCL